MLLGNVTGRDGIGGVSVLASAGFGDDTEAEQAKRPNVQVGDPFEEKRLIEACLQLLDEGLVVGIQDLGGAGLACATSETASRGGVGMDVNVSVVPRREPGMAPWEVMTSESQERMLAIVSPDTVDRVLAVCRRWEVRATVVGKVTGTGRLRILDDWDGAVLADVPASTLHDDAPSITGLWRPRSIMPPARRMIRAGYRPPPIAGWTSWRCWWIRPGCTGNTIISCFSTPSWRQEGTPPCCAWPPPACGRRGPGCDAVWPCRPMATPGGARSTPGPARPSSWPSRRSTWPASGRGRWRWSIAATSETPSIPR